MEKPSLNRKGGLRYNLPSILNSVLKQQQKNSFSGGEKKDFCLDVRKPKSKKSCFPIVNQKKGNLKSRNDFFSFENENRETTTKKPLFNFILSL